MVQRVSRSGWVKSMARPWARRFVRDQRGATLIEFGILAPVFFVLIGATLETGIVFLANEVLDSAVQDSTRKILTGEAQNQSLSAEGFRALICQDLYGLFDCNQLRIKVDVISDFKSAAIEPPIDPNDPTQWKIQSTYNPGQASEIVRVQAYYKWPTIMNFAGFNLATYSDGTRLLGAVRVFKNEPFQ
ncbi:pilus assembly protein [Devosia sp. H5989]|uniref:Pilus assembly protein n=2 Tax=Paradevosia tibetensis TaxID=1447062 RepID=A0A5B9DIV5_9HYPH|nr:pilus assembly protein [Devosia sp. H5989]QEE18755.1 pilus assembly protein [Youhaiella tibetensis]